MAIISAVPGLNLLNCLCCAGILIGGASAVFFYQKDLTAEHPPLTNSDALQLGVLAGVFGAILSTAISQAILAAFGNVTSEFVQGILASHSSELPPGTMDQISNSLRHGGFTFLQLISSLVIDCIFGLLGGLIGYAIWKPKPGPMPPPTYMPPQPPAQQ